MQLGQSILCPLCYVILGLFPSTLIFWEELNCRHKSYTNKAMMFLGQSHQYKNSSRRTWSGWLLQNIHTSNDNGSFPFYIDFCLLLLLRLLCGLTKWEHRWCLVRSRNCLPFALWLIFLVFWFLFCLYSPCVLCAQCCQYLWIVFVLFVFVLCLVYPMLLVSLCCMFLFCLSSSCVLCTQCY